MKNNISAKLVIDKFMNSKEKFVLILLGNCVLRSAKKVKHDCLCVGNGTGVQL